MLTSLIYGLVASSGLFIGAYLGIRFNFKRITNACIMAFGSGVLIATLASVLMEEAYERANGAFHIVTLGFIAGGAAFVVLDYVVDILGGSHRKHKKSIRAKALANDKAIALGALLDGIPEAIVIGIGVAQNAGLGLLMLIAVLLNNVPEGISGVHGLKNAEKSRKFMYTLWTLITVVCAISAVFGYVKFQNASPLVVSLALSLAAGSILAMVSETLIPEALDEGGRRVTMFLLFGFLVIFELSHLVS